MLHSLHHTLKSYRVCCLSKYSPETERAARDCDSDFSVEANNIHEEEGFVQNRRLLSRRAVFRIYII